MYCDTLDSYELSNAFSAIYYFLFLFVMLINTTRAIFQMIANQRFIKLQHCEFVSRLESTLYPWGNCLDSGCNIVDMVWPRYIWCHCNSKISHSFNSDSLKVTEYENCPDMIEARIYSYLTCVYEKCTQSFL